MAYFWGEGVLFMLSFYMQNVEIQLIWCKTVIRQRDCGFISGNFVIIFFRARWCPKFLDGDTIVSEPQSLFIDGGTVVSEPQVAY